MPTDKTLFGQIALSRGLIDERKLRSLLEQQKLFQPPVPIGEMMLSEGLLDAAQIDEILAAQKRLRESRIIAGYELLSKIGSGGMGVVYKARKEGIEKVVALKILVPTLARDTAYIERFFREARSAGKLNHPNIVAGFDVGESGGYYYFAMEYIEGETVGQMLKRRGKLPEDEALDIVCQVADALVHAHSLGFVHRDIKPDNIIVTPSGQAKLTDLGLAKAETINTSVTQEGSSIGTPSYSSPEQAKGSFDIDIRSDIYSLGATLYRMIAGKQPFTGPTPAAILAKQITESLPPLFEMKKTFSEPVARLIKKMMAKERNARHASPAELLQEITAIRHREESKPAAAPLKKRPIPERTRSSSALTGKLVAGAAAAALFVCAIVIVMIFSRGVKDEPPSSADVVHAQAPPDQPPVIDKAAERQAQSLRALHEVIAAEEQRPDDYDALAAAYLKVWQEFSDTAAGGDAQARREQLMERRLQAVEAALRAASTSSAQLLQESRFGRALEIWQRLAHSTFGVELHERIQVEIEAVEAAATKKMLEIIDGAEALAHDEKYEEAASEFAVVFERFGLPEAQEKARTMVEHYDKLHDERLAGLARGREGEDDFRVQIHDAGKLLGALRIDEAVEVCGRLEADAPRHMLHHVQSLRDDTASITRLRGLLAEYINAEPEKTRFVTLDTGRNVSVTSLAATDAGLSLTTQQVEMFFSWDKLSPYWLLSVCRSAAPDEPLLLAVLAHYAGHHTQSQRYLDSASAIEGQREEREAMRLRFDENLLMERAFAVAEAVKSTRELIAAGNVEAATPSLEQLRAQIAQFGLEERYADDVAALAAENDELRAEALLGSARVEAERRNWKAVDSIAAKLQKEFGGTRLVRITAADEIASLKTDSERLLVNRDMLAAVRHFIALEDAPARALFVKVIRENEGSLADDARTFLTILEANVPIQPAQDCAQLTGIVELNPGALQRIAGLRRAMHSDICKGSFFEARARNIIGFTLYDEMNRPVLAREVFQTVTRGFSQFSQHAAYAYVQIGRIEGELGNWAAAVRHYDTVIRNYPNEQDMCAWATQLKAEYYRRSGDLTRAVRLLEEAVLKYPSGGAYLSDAQLMLARIYRDELDRKEAALKAFREISDRGLVRYYERERGMNDRTTAAALFYAAELLLEKGELEEARARLRLVGGPYFTMARQKLAELDREEAQE